MVNFAGAGAAVGACWRRLRLGIPPFVKGVLRRQSEILLPDRAAREYRLWIAERVRDRRSVYADAFEPGLLSVLTPVWNRSPVKYLKALANCLINQNPEGFCEWVILDNGCSSASLRSCLAELRTHKWVKLFRVETNIGIIGGLRYCLEHAHGRYVMPVDADDYLYPDALQVITSFVRRASYPPLLYTDEDKIIGTKLFEPYLKPDWDPVLLLNSAYIAHLGIIDREKALELNAYADSRAEGSPDWDLFIRFMVAGYTAIHIPEVLYSWRVHAHSTADDAATKPYVRASQKAVLQRFLDAQPDPGKFGIENSPLLPGAAHWYFCRRHSDARPLASAILTHRSGNESPAPSLAEGDDYPQIKSIRLALDAGPECLRALAGTIAEQGGLVRLIGEDVEIDSAQWAWETVALFELHPDTVMIGGRIRTHNGIITEAGRYFGFAGSCGCPHRGRSFLDPGYFAQIWKQRSVSAVSTQLAVIKATFLLELLDALQAEASMAFLGAWAGAYAMRTGRRIVYSPFLSGVSDVDWDAFVLKSEADSFARENSDMIPDHRFYSRYLSLEAPFALSRKRSPHINLKIAS